MEYYGASASDRAVIATLLDLDIANMGQDWEFTLSSQEIIAPSINALLMEGNSKNIKMAIACILISSLYEHYRDTHQDHQLYTQALAALKKDSDIHCAMHSFWLPPEAKPNQYLAKIFE